MDEEPTNALTRSPVQNRKGGKGGKAGKGVNYGAPRHPDPMGAAEAEYRRQMSFGGDDSYRQVLELRVRMQEAALQQLQHGLSAGTDVDNQGQTIILLFSGGPRGAMRQHC